MITRPARGARHLPWGGARGPGHGSYDRNNATGGGAVTPVQQGEATRALAINSVALNAPEAAG